MSDVQQGPYWWRATDGRWYPPETHPGYRPAERPASRSVRMWQRVAWGLAGGWAGTTLGMALFTPQGWLADVIFGGFVFGVVAFGVCFGIAAIATPKR